uniref:Uncharacterized protein n=1 Tax=Denticeps clupeoides TaxID=299321 RepID=A0AAY4ADG6_9TELE
MTKTGGIGAMDYSHLWLPDIRMSKPVEAENSGADSPADSAESERNGPEIHHQVGFTVKPSLKYIYFHY